MAKKVSSLKPAKTSTRLGPAIERPIHFTSRNSKENIFMSKVFVTLCRFYLQCIQAMKALLNIHAFFWWINDNPKLLSNVRKIISVDNNKLYISTFNG
jgi:hypothetical protein